MATGNSEQLRQVQQFLMALQDTICNELEHADGKGIFVEDARRPKVVLTMTSEKRSAWGLGWFRCPSSNPGNAIVVNVQPASPSAA